MTIAEKLAVVSHAETDCVVHSAAARAAWRGFTVQLRQAATPSRVVIGGLVSGFFAGIRKSSAGPGVVDRLATTVLQSVIATIGAGATAGAAVDAAARPAASAAASAAAQATTTTTRTNGSRPAAETSP